MPDPFETLRRPDVVAPALPPAEVRRRGDRMRRRRTALTAVGAVAAVAVMVSGGLLTTGGSTGSAPQPGPASQAPAPSLGPGGTKHIPAAFPLTLGLPRPGGGVSEVRSRLRTVPFAMDPCRGTRANPAVERTDYAEVRQSVMGGGDSVRQLAVYRDADTADAVLRSLSAAVQACPTTDVGGGSVDRWTLRDGPAGTGDASFVAVAHRAPDGRRAGQDTVYLVLRKGDAVLLLATDAELGASTRSPDAMAADLHDDGVRLAASMCPFSADGCTDENVLDGDGYAGLRLGADRAAVAANPQVASLPPAGAGACVQGRLYDGGTFYLSDRLGVVGIWLGGKMHTAAGISTASTEDEVKAAYPQGHEDVHRYWTVPLGHGTRYQFGFDADGSMSEGSVGLAQQDCFG